MGRKLKEVIHATTFNPFYRVNQRQSDPGNHQPEGKFQQGLAAVNMKTRQYIPMQQEVKKDKYGDWKEFYFSFHGFS